MESVLLDVCDWVFVGESSRTDVDDDDDVFDVVVVVGAGRS